MALILRVCSNVNRRLPSVGHNVPEMIHWNKDQRTYEPSLKMTQI